MKQYMILFGFLIFSLISVHAGYNYKTKTYSHFKNNFTRITLDYEANYITKDYNLRTTNYYSQQFTSNKQLNKNLATAVVLNSVSLAGVGLNTLIQNSKFNIDDYIFFIEFKISMNSILIWNHFQIK